MDSVKYWLYSSTVNPKFRICGNCGAGFVTAHTTGWKGCPMCMTTLQDKGVITDE